MQVSIKDILSSYNRPGSAVAGLDHPGALVRRSAHRRTRNAKCFCQTWQLVARTSQLENGGDFVTARLAGEPIVVVRGADGVLRGFYNVCRHHAAAVVTQSCGQAQTCSARTGWKYGLDGALKGTPEFEGVQNFDRAENGLVPILVETWECFVFVNLDPQAEPLLDFLGGLVKRVAPLGISKLHYFDRRTYDINCNWKVYV